MEGPTGQHEITVEIDIGLVAPPPPSETKWIQSVQEHQTNRKVILPFSPLTQQSELDCCADEPLHSVNSARNDHCRVSSGLGAESHIDGEFFPSRAPQLGRV